MTDTKSRRFRGVALLSRVMTGAHAVSVEQAVASQTCVYEDKLRQMYWNVKKVPGLLDMYSTDQLVCLDNATMARHTDVEAWERGFQQKLKSEEELSSRAPPVSSNLVRCRKCKSQDISTNQVQTRGADEAMTVFHECNNCGIRWKS